MAYQNLVGTFVYKEPLFRAKLDALAENDAQLKVDGWAQNTKGLFYQAAVPTGWTQDVTQDDKALRVVGSTGGGVSGGTQVLSATVTVAHTHSISAAGSHTHAYAAHTHTAGDASLGRNSNEVIASNGGFLFRYTETGGGASINELLASLATPGAITLGTEPNHDHGGATGTSLTDFVFAY